MLFQKQSVNSEFKSGNMTKNKQFATMKEIHRSKPFNNVFNQFVYQKENPTIQEIENPILSVESTEVMAFLETEKMEISLEALTEWLSFEEKVTENLNQLNSMADLMMEEIPEQEKSISEDEAMARLLMQLEQKIKDILVQLHLQMNALEFDEPQNIFNLARNLQQLFQRWMDLPQEAKLALEDSELFHLQELEEEMTLLKELFAKFEKRGSFIKQQIYQVDATITNEDIQKWLEQALERHMVFGETKLDAATENKHHQSGQMSKVEQFILRATNADRIEAISRNLVQDINRIVTKNNFLKQPGLDQLTFTLRPASLGEVTIKLVQVNGEMTVKFFVATQAARELLEANMNQLKPMFSPHQIAIERDAAVSDEEFFHEEQGQSGEEEQNEKENRQSRNEDTNEETELSFDELLLNLRKEATA